MSIKKPVIIYLCIWAALVAAFWLGLKDDAMLYSIIMNTVLIASSIIFPWIIVKRKPTRKAQLIIIVCIGIMVMLAEYLTFSLANNIEFDKVNMPEWSLLFIGILTSFVSTEWQIKRLT